MSHRCLWTLVKSKQSSWRCSWKTWLWGNPVKVYGRLWWQGYFGWSWVGDGGDMWWWSKSRRQSEESLVHIDTVLYSHQQSYMKACWNYRSTPKGGSEGPEICLRSIVFGKTIYNLWFQHPTTPNQALLNRTLWSLCYALAVLGYVSEIVPSESPKPSVVGWGLPGSNGEEILCVDTLGWYGGCHGCRVWMTFCIPLTFWSLRFLKFAKISR